jgi:hypothetical protein
MSTTPCSLQAETGPAVVYREYAPPPALKTSIVCTWTLEIRGGEQPHQPHQQHVLPDGCADVEGTNMSMDSIVRDGNLAITASDNSSRHDFGTRISHGRSASPRIDRDRAPNDAQTL